ncbi:MAG: AAA family ATPase [Candidatus Improbicoccus devescovinae]|nr:MAG: AAA family ATPase [Candidatus Improbicoccus devescovinae]
MPENNEQDVRLKTPVEPMRFCRVAKTLYDIFNDDELMDQFLSLSTVEEVHDFCKDVSVDGFDSNDFYAYMNIVLIIIEKNLYRKDKEFWNIIHPEDDKIGLSAGGKSGNFKNKFVAGALAAMSTFGTMQNAQAGAAVYRRHKEPEPASQAVTKKVSNKRSGIKSFFRRHSSLLKKIGIGVAGTAVAAGVVFGLKKLSDHLKKDKPDLTDAKKKRIEDLNKSINSITKGKEIGDLSEANQKLVIDLQAQKYNAETSPAVKDEDLSDSLVKRVTRPVLAIGAPVFAVATLGGMVMDKASNVSKQLNNIGQLDYAIEGIKRTWQRWADKFSNTKKELPPTNDAVDRLDNVFDLVKGQEAAKAQLRNIAADIIIKKDMQRKTKTEPTGAELIFLVGSSGTGKTFTMQQVAPELSSSTLPTYIYTSGNVNIDSGKNVVDQIFGSTKKRYYGSEQEEASSLAAEIKKDKNRVFILDEYDKYSSRALDEVLRTAHDFGYIMLPDGEKLDVTGTIFACTSNELSPKEMTDIPRFLTKSRTLKHRDASFCNRASWVTFEQHSTDTFREMLLDHFFEQVANYWALDDVAKMSLGLDPTCVDWVCKWLQYKDQGARPIDLEILPAMNAAIVQAMKTDGLDSLRKTNKKIIIEPEFLAKSIKNAPKPTEQPPRISDTDTEESETETQKEPETNYKIDYEIQEIKFKLVDDNITQEEAMKDINFDDIDEDENIENSDNTNDSDYTDDNSETENPDEYEDPDENPYENDVNPYENPDYKQDENQEEEPWDEANHDHWENTEKNLENKTPELTPELNNNPEPEKNQEENSDNKTPDFNPELDNNPEPEKNQEENSENKTPDFNPELDNIPEPEKSQEENLENNNYNKPPRRRIKNSVNPDNLGIPDEITEDNTQNKNPITHRRRRIINQNNEANLNLNPEKIIVPDNFEDDDEHFER